MDERAAGPCRNRESKKDKQASIANGTCNHTVCMYDVSMNVAYT
jgi:hypothetical protein